jgi:hypothetical protein
MSDIKTILKEFEETGIVSEADKAPPKFKPTHFHKSNLFGAKTKLMYYKGKFWKMGQDEEGRTKIVRWFGNPNNRSKLNPASVDGEIVNGKYKEYPEGTTFADTQKSKEKESDQEKDSGEEKVNPLSKLDKAGADKAADEKLKRLLELLDALEESAVIFRNAGILSERELSDSEKQELSKLIADLEVLKANPNLSKANARMIDAQVQRVPSELKTTGIDQGDGAKSFPAGDYMPPKFEPEVDDDAEKALSRELATGADKEADKPASKVASGSLEKFAKSGKGGLANDPEEEEAIDELQRYLNDLGFDTGTPDGKYGRKTIQGVRDFQKYFGAKQDGDAGPETIGQIIKLRSIMFKGGKNFADFRRDMTRMEELLAKAGSKAESKNMNSMSSILEAFRRLDEALDDKEKKELADLVAQYDDIMNDGEFSQAIPKPSYDRYAKIYNSAKEIAAEVEPEAEPEAKPGEEEPEMDQVKKPRTDAEVSADPDRDGNADDPEAQTFIDDNLPPSGLLRRALFGPGTNEPTIFRVMSAVKNKAAWVQLQKEYKEQYGNDLIADLKDDMGESEMVRYVWDPLEDNAGLSRQEAETGSAPAEEPAATTEPEASDTAAKTEPEAGDTAPMTAKEAADVINQYAEFADEIMPQLTPQEQSLFREMMKAAEEETSGASTRLGREAD